MSAQSLNGPFNAEGSAKYMDEILSFTVKSGRFEQGNSLPLSVTLKNKGGDLDISYSGIVDTKDAVEIQGETAITVTKMSALIERLTGQPEPAGLGGVGTFQLKGLLTASADGVWLNNAFLKVNERKADVKLELSGFKNDILTVATTVEFKELFDVDAFMGLLREAGLAAPKSAAASSGKAVNDKGDVAPFLPAQIILPKNVNANIHLAVPGLTYRGKETGQIRIGAAYAKGELKADIDALTLPGTTTFKAQTLLKYQDVTQNGLQVTMEKPVMDTTISLDTKNIRDVLVEWLGVVDAAQLPKDMPNIIVMKAGVKVKDATVRADLLDVNIGETKLEGFAEWTQRKSKPLLVANLKGGQLTVPDFGAGKTDAAATPQKPAVDLATGAAQAAVIPVMPFDADVALDIQRLQYGDKVFHNLKTDFDLTGPLLKLNSLSIGDHMGAAMTVSGYVGNLQDLSDMSVKASVKSQNIDTLLAGYNVKIPENLPSPIGALSAEAQASGSAKKANFNLSVNAYDFSAKASGVANNIMSPSIPNQLSVALSHPNSARALRFFDAGYRASSPLMDKPLELSADLISSGKSYTLNNGVFKIGPSSIKGKAEVSMAGAVPYVNATIAADNLPISVLMGKTDAATATSGAATTSTPQAGTTPWTRDAINTDALRAVNADLNVTAAQLSYGNTVLQNAILALNLKDGVMTISQVKGGLDQGTLEGKAVIRATEARKPVEITADFALKDASMQSATKAMLGKASKTMAGDVGFDVSVNASGISSAALMNALNGQGNFAVTDPVLRGLDVKALYESLRSLDNFRGSVAGFLQGTTSSGSTAFNSVQKAFTIANGAINVENWALKTDHATMLSNGKIDFANWKIDLDNQIQIEDIANVPSFGMRVYGPLDNPQQAFVRQGLEDFMSSRLGAKAQEFIGEKLGDKLGGELGGLLPLLGGGRAQPQQAPAPAPANDNATTGTTTDQVQPQAQPEPQPQPQPQQDPTEQMFRGLLNELTR